MEKEEWVSAAEDDIQQSKSLTVRTLPLVALRDLSVFPEMVLHFDIQRERSVQAVERAMTGSGELLVVTQRSAAVENPQAEDLYTVGTIVMIRQISRMKGKIVRVLAEGMTRVRVKELHTAGLDERVYLEAAVEVCEETSELPENEQTARVSYIKELMGQYGLFYPKIGKAIGIRLEEQQDIGKLVDVAIMNMPVATDEKQSVLEAVDLEERYRVAVDLIYREVEIAKIKLKLTEGVKQRVDKNQREYVLREQLGYIREELGDDRTFSDAEQFEKAVEKLTAKKEIKERIKKEISRFKSVATSISLTLSSSIW